MILEGNPNARLRAKVANAVHLMIRTMTVILKMMIQAIITMMIIIMIAITIIIIIIIMIINLPDACTHAPRSSPGAPRGPPILYMYIT